MSDSRKIHGKRVHLNSSFAAKNYSCWVLGLSSNRWLTVFSRDKFALFSLISHHAVSSLPYCPHGSMCEATHTKSIPPILCSLLFEEMFHFTVQVSVYYIDLHMIMWQKWISLPSNGKDMHGGRVCFCCVVHPLTAPGVMSLRNRRSSPDSRIFLTPSSYPTCWSLFNKWETWVNVVMPGLFIKIIKCISWCR